MSAAGTVEGDTKSPADVLQSMTTNIIHAYTSSHICKNLKERTLFYACIFEPINSASQYRYTPQCLQDGVGVPTQRHKVRPISSYGCSSNR